MSSDTPNTREIARRLGVDDENLNIFVKHHSEPTAESVLIWSGADREHVDTVKKWLDALEDDHAGRRDRLGGEVREKVTRCRTCGSIDVDLVIDTGELCDQCNRVSVPGGEGE